MLFSEGQKLIFCFHRVLLVPRDPLVEMVLLVRG